MSASLQNYNRIYTYITEYQKLVYDVYSKHAIAFRVNYYNINKDSTVWDDQKLMDGAYESIGSLSGVKWNKYSQLPVYFLEPMTTQFNATEEGVTKENETYFVIPDAYGITPYAGDLMRPILSFLNTTTSDSCPIYRVTGAEISANAQRRFWKLRAETYQSRSIDEIDSKIANTYVFFEYTKQIVTQEKANILSELASKYDKLTQNLNNFYDPNSGLYLI